MRTYDKKDVFCILNAEGAEQYIGKEGYFSNYLDPNLEHREWHFGTLMRILIDRSFLTDCFSAYVEDEDEDYLFSYGLFLPADKVKEVEE